METSYLKTLELDKIIARAAEGCVCKEAKAKLLALEPQCDPDEVRYALEQTDAINTLLIKNGSPRFGGVEGVSALAARAVKGGVLSMGELLMVAGALRNFQNLTNWYGSSEHDMLPTDDLFYALSPEPGLEQQISSAILAPDAMADTASRTLNDLRKKIRATENSIRDRLESMVRNMDTSKYLQESVVSMRNGRYVVPVKSEYRGEVSGIIHDVSSTGATVFVEPQAVVEANARILQYRAQEAQEIERILVAFTAQVAAIEPQFQYSYQAMLDIDVLLAKARLALELKAFKPAVRTDNSFSLIRARHPLIDPQKCVPVDIALGKEYDSLIITGPNTGGKTVTLKTAGLLCAMAQCGFLIPADERSEVCVFDEFLVDIGDEQSIEQSLSTFSGHMKKITGILELAMPHTLVLLDELGAGTDPAEGAALAVAIIEELRRRGVLLMATTHYAELKVFALETKGVVNASCEFDLETLRPTYKLSVGVPGKSNAFLISEKLGIPERVIEAAQQHLSAEDKRLDAVLGQLDDLKLQLKESQHEVEELKNEASHQLEAAQKKRDELIQQGENELEAARAKARALAQQVESQAYALTDELRQLQMDERLSTPQKAQRGGAQSGQGICAAERGQGRAGGLHRRAQPAGHGAFAAGQERRCSGTGRHHQDQGPAQGAQTAGKAGQGPETADQGTAAVFPPDRRRKPSEWPRGAGAPQRQNGVQSAGIDRGRGPARGGFLHRPRHSERPDRSLPDPRQWHRRTAHCHPQAPARQPHGQELPSGPLRRRRKRRDRRGAEIRGHFKACPLLMGRLFACTAEKSRVYSYCKEKFSIWTGSYLSWQDVINPRTRKRSDEPDERGVPFSERLSCFVFAWLPLFFRRFSGEKHCGFLHKSREVSLHPERRFGRRWATRRIV